MQRQIPKSRSPISNAAVLTDQHTTPISSLPKRCILIKDAQRSPQGFICKSTIFNKSLTARGSLTELIFMQLSTWQLVLTGLLLP